MNHLCTLSDYSYLAMGLALHDSLKQTSKEEFTLNYLCLDKKTYDKLLALNIPEIKPLYIEDLLNSQEDLASYTIKEYREFVWMLASYFSEYFLRTTDVPSITYIDSDIYFYDDIQKFYDEVGNKSVGIIRHRHVPLNLESPDGKFNVGIVYFKADETGKACAAWWKDAVMNKKYPELSTCYDQKYLEGFLKYFDAKKIAIVDETFCHGAPWHYRLYDWSDTSNGMVSWDGKRQKFLFNHFSRFKYDLDEGWFTPCGNNYLDHTKNNAVFDIPAVKAMYQNYYREIKNVSFKYDLQS